MAGPVGPIIAAPGQYTHCVDRSVYRNLPNLDLNMGFAAFAELGCDYLLGGKLVCLAGGQDECVIGFVAGVEAVKRANVLQVLRTWNFAALDNDFTFNVLVVPFQPDDFAFYRANVADQTTFEPHKIYNDVAASNSPFARLMVDPQPSPTPLPRPLDAYPGQTNFMDGYGVLYQWDDATQHLVYRQATAEPSDYQDNLHKIWDEAPPPGSTPHNGSFISIPVLHCECEGSRTLFECQALRPFLDLMQGKVPGSPLPSLGEACDDAIGWIPVIGDAICALVDDFVNGAVGLILSGAILAAFASAWEAAQIYDDLFVTGPVAHQIHIGDLVIVTGRWVWDGGHIGQAELHPVKTIQKVLLPAELRGGYDPRNQLRPDIVEKIRDVRDRWCRLVSEAPPPPDPHHPGDLLSPEQLGSLSPEQGQIYQQQLQPENRWRLHPLLDGCAPQQGPG
jgi:hypothetical protein